MNVRVGIRNEDGTFTNQTVPAKPWKEVQGLFTKASAFTIFTDAGDQIGHALQLAENLRVKTGFSAEPEQRLSDKGLPIVVVRKQPRTSAMDYLQAWQ